MRRLEKRKSRNGRIGMITILLMQNRNGRGQVNKDRQCNLQNTNAKMPHTKVRLKFPYVHNFNKQIQKMDSIFLFLIVLAWIDLFVIFVTQIVKHGNTLEYSRLLQLSFHFIMKACQHFYERFIQL